MFVASARSGAFKTIVVRFTIDAVGAASYVRDDAFVSVPYVGVVEVFFQLSISASVGGEGKPSGGFADGIVSDFWSSAVDLLDERGVRVSDEVSVHARKRGDHSFLRYKVCYYQQKVSNIGNNVVTGTPK